MEFLLYLCTHKANKANLLTNDLSYTTMKARLSTWLNTLSGSMGDRVYASKCPNEPGWVILKKKPGPHNPSGTRKERRWVMPEKQAAGVERMMDIQRRATEEYHNPEKRAIWQKEYEEWVRREKKNNRTGTELNGKKVRFLWDYVRIRVKEMS